VPPSVWYGTSSLLIRNISGSVSDLVEWRGTANTSLIPSSARGAIAMRILSNATIGGHKMHIFTANIPPFHSRYRR
jgi:hypothetical protein